MKIPKYLGIILLVIVAAVVALFVDKYFGNYIYRHYQPIANGVVGVAVLLLLFQVYIVPKQWVENNFHLRFVLL